MEEWSDRRQGRIGPEGSKICDGPQEQAGFHQVDRTRKVWREDNEQSTEHVQEIVNLQGTQGISKSGCPWVEKLVINTCQFIQF